MMARLEKVLVLVVLLATSGCGTFLYTGLADDANDLDRFMTGLAAAAGKTSPAVYEIDARVAPGFGVGDGNLTLHPTVGYSRSFAGGVEGETDDKLYLGAQVRAPVSQSGVWIGGEAAYARRWTGYDDPAFETDGSNGFTLAGLAGLPLGSSGFGAVAAAGINKYGGTGWYARLGFEYGF